MLKSETQSISGNFSARFNFPLKLTMNLNQTKIKIPYLDNEQKLKASENIWSTLGANFQYSFLQNKLRLNGGADYMTNGQANNIYGFKFGTDWEVINKLTLSLYMALRLANKEVSNSGTNFSLGYRF